MLKFAAYGVIVITILIGVARCFRDRKSKNRWKLFVQNGIGMATVLMVYMGAWMAGAHIYIENTENVTPIFQTVQLEEITGTSLLETSGKRENPKVYLQVTKSESKEAEVPEFFVVKVKGHRYRMPAHSTAVDYRNEPDRKIIVKAMIINKSPLSELFQLDGRTKSVSYHVYIPRDSIDLVSAPVPEDFPRYPAPKEGINGATYEPIE